jgi:acyl-CoA oxidase
MTTSVPASTTLRTLLDGEHAEIRDGVRAWLSRPGNAAVADLPREQHRAQVLAWAQELAAKGGTTLGFPVEYGGHGLVGGSVAAFETLAFGDLSLLVDAFGVPEPAQADAQPVAQELERAA